MELIKIQQTGSIETVNARDLWSKLESKQDFTNWIKSRLEGFIEKVDFAIILSESTGGRPRIEYYVSIETAKHIAMLERNEKGREVRQYFIDVEKKSKEIIQTPKTLAQALRLAADQAELIEQQQQQLAIAAPKVEFYDAVTGSSDTIDIGEAAKILAIPGLGRNNMLAKLREKGILMRNNQPYQKHIDAGHFRTVESKYVKPDGSICINIKTVVHQKGLDYIRKILQ